MLPTITFTLPIADTGYTLMSYGYDINNRDCFRRDLANMATNTEIHSTPSISHISNSC